jgi:hypothetical protein
MNRFWASTILVTVLSHVQLDYDLVAAMSSRIHSADTAERVCRRNSHYTHVSYW